MKIFKCNVKLRCDIGSCRNRAVYVIDDGYSKKHTVLCEACLKEIADNAAKLFTPKGVDNFVAKAQKNAQYVRGASVKVDNILSVE